VVTLGSPFKSRLRLEAENAALRHQLMVLRRRLQGRIQLTNHDYWFLIVLYRWFPSIFQVLTVIRPETLIRTTTSSASKSSWQRTTASPQHRIAPVIEQRRRHNAYLVAAARRIDADGHQLDQVLSDVVVNEPIVLE
jgi:hypothetical protein